MDSGESTMQIKEEIDIKENSVEFLLSEDIVNSEKYKGNALLIDHEVDTKQELCWYEEIKQESDIDINVLTTSIENTKTNLDINTVQYIISNGPLTYADKILIKQKGRPMPELEINNALACKSCSYKRQFNKNIYDKYDWICGCEVTNKLFCFFCLLFKHKRYPWMEYGVNDLKDIAKRARRHENSMAHLNAALDYNVLGKIDVPIQLNKVFLENKLKHYEAVEKNRHILRRLITCIKFCGAFDLVLRGRDESISSKCPGVCMSLINFTAELDSVFATHIKEAEIFNEPPKVIQNDLLDVMLDVYRAEVIREIRLANFIALQADEIVDTSSQQQMVVIIRYVSSGRIVRICERFWSFIKPAGYTADDLSNALLEELRVILDCPADESKLIAQSYDGSIIMSCKNKGVQGIIKQTFPNAYFVDCYAHHFNVIMERAAQCNKRLKLFFADLQAFSSFFSQSSRYVSILDEVVKKRSGMITIPWSLKCRTVKALYEYRDCFLECLEIIMNMDGVGSRILNQANGLINSLKCPEFLYWLKIFHEIVPHVEQFFSKTRGCGIDSSGIKQAVGIFEKQIINIKQSLNVQLCIDSIVSEGEEEPASKRCKIVPDEDTRNVVANEVCDNILEQIKNRFEFTGHVDAAKLFESRNFNVYRQTFPQNSFDSTVMSYPMLDSAKLKSELTIIYNRDDMRVVNDVLSLLMFISNNNLKSVLTETYKLLDILCTTPMPAGESQRHFSTLKRIETFLRSTNTENRLNALAVLSIEKKFIRSIPDFDDKVIDAFSKIKDKQVNFIVK